MVKINLPKMQAVYSATDNNQQREAYDDWAESYDADLLGWGFRLPTIAASVFTMHVGVECGSILDAGCGTGLQSIALAALGYRPITGIDLSPGMLAEAKKKRIYDELLPMTLGERLDLADGSFGATFAIGCITPGHAPANSYDELIRVTKPGGLIVFSSRVDDGQDPTYQDAISAHEKAGRWLERYRSPRFRMLPELEPEIEPRDVRVRGVRLTGF